MGRRIGHEHKRGAAGRSGQRGREPEGRGESRGHQGRYVGVGRRGHAGAGLGARRSADGVGDKGVGGHEEERDNRRRGVRLLGARQGEQPAHDGGEHHALHQLAEHRLERGARDRVGGAGDEGVPEHQGHRASLGDFSGVWTCAPPDVPAVTYDHTVRAFFVFFNTTRTPFLIFNLGILKCIRFDLANSTGHKS